jgi:hypothetical protein
MDHTTAAKKERKREKVKKLLSGATRSLDKESSSSSSDKATSPEVATKKKKSGSVRVARVTPSTTRDNKLKEAAERRKSHIPTADQKSPRGGGGDENVRFDGNVSVASLTQELEEEWEGARDSREAATRFSSGGTGSESDAHAGVDELVAGHDGRTDSNAEYDYIPVMSPRVRQTSLEGTCTLTHSPPTTLCFHFFL